MSVICIRLTFFEMETDNAHSSFDTTSDIYYTALSSSYSTGVGVSNYSVSLVTKNLDPNVTDVSNDTEVIDKTLEMTQTKSDKHSQANPSKKTSRASFKKIELKNQSEQSTKIYMKHIDSITRLDAVTLEPTIKLNYKPFDKQCNSFHFNNVLFSLKQTDDLRREIRSPNRIKRTFKKNLVLYVHKVFSRKFYSFAYIKHFFMKNLFYFITQFIFCAGHFINLNNVLPLLKQISNQYTHILIIILHSIFAFMGSISLFCVTLKKPGKLNKLSSGERQNSLYKYENEICIYFESKELKLKFCQVSG